MQRATGALSSGAGSCPQLNSTLNAESCERKAEMQSVRWKISVGQQGWSESNPWTSAEQEQGRKNSL